MDVEQVSHVCDAPKLINLTKSFKATWLTDQWLEIIMASSKSFVFKVVSEIFNLIWFKGAIHHE